MAKVDKVLSEAFKGDKDNALILSKDALTVQLPFSSPMMIEKISYSYVKDPDNLAEPAVKKGNSQINALAVKFEKDIQKVVDSTRSDIEKAMKKSEKTR